MKKKKDINSTNVLTVDEKKYLNRICNYLNSLGIKYGTIEIDINEPGMFDVDDINWDEINHFSNNYSAQIPEGLKPILIKIFDYIKSKDLYEDVDETLYYENISIDIDTESREISVNHRWAFNGRGDVDSITYDSQEDSVKFAEWRNNEFATINIPNNGILTLKYNGSGDSGYIEDYFDEINQKVPIGIENWCYNALSDNFGGWEINEGSDGEFVFDFNNNEVTLNHIYNTDVDESDTIYEENFAQ